MVGEFTEAPIRHMTATLLRHMTARRLKGSVRGVCFMCTVFFPFFLSFFQGIKELNVYQQSEHNERPVSFFKEKQRDGLRRKRDQG